MWEATSPRNKINMNRQALRQRVAWTRALASVLAHATGHLIVRVGTWRRWDVARWKCGKWEMWSEIGRNEKRNMEKRTLRWLDA
jgi:hypothetical protein